jgi:hypothetical protein
LSSIISNSELIIVPLDEDYDLFSFSCASSELNDFLKEDAFNDQEDLISKTSLCFWKGELVGYITLATDTICFILDFFHYETFNKFNRKNFIKFKTTIIFRYQEPYKKVLMYFL